MDDIRKLMDENKKLKESLSRFTDECERLTEENKDLKELLRKKHTEVLRLQGMVDAFEICVKARK